MNGKKKLIETALPLDAINRESAREKSIRHGHPSTLHLWWARRPLAACRAVLFAQLVDDPSAHPDKFPTEEDQRRERERLFGIIEDLVKWENINNERVLRKAREEILKSTDGHPPAVLDPFCGGGSIPLEAQRLGLQVYAGDLNPVAVLITKALIEIPPRFADLPPVSAFLGASAKIRKGDDFSGNDGLPPAVSAGRTLALPGRQLVGEWKGARGLAEDVRYYGQWMRNEAERRIGHLYPKVKAWFDPKSRRWFEDARVQEWRKAMAAGKSHAEGEQTARECGYPSLASLLSRLSPQELTVIAWLWARTVKCPNPACGAQMPLVRSFDLSTRKGSRAWLEPIVHGSDYSFVVRIGQGKGREGTVNRRGASCIGCGSAVAFEHVRSEAIHGRMDSRLMAVVCESKNARIYLEADINQEEIAKSSEVENAPDTDLPARALGFRVQAYGMVKHRHLCTPRQLTALTTFSDLVQEVRERVKADAQRVGWPIGAQAFHPHKGRAGIPGSAAVPPAESAGQRPALPEEDVSLAEGGMGAQAYADAVATYLALAVDRLADYSSSICSWHVSGEKMRNTFARQAIPMVWDFAEANPFSDSTGNFQGAVEWVARALETLPASGPGVAFQQDATAPPAFIEPTADTDHPGSLSENEFFPGSSGVQPAETAGQRSALSGKPSDSLMFGQAPTASNFSSPSCLVVSTDPPYYDNIGYADLSDFFYVWLRRSLRDVYPQLFSTMLVPKAQELVATPYRFNGSKQAAQEFFEEGLRKCFHWMSRTVSANVPVTIYYAFKQSERVETENGNGDIIESTASTGWETMLEGLVQEGFSITATWPMRTELGNRTVAMGTNALASSIVLACRPRAEDAPETTRRDFVMALKQELPQALRTLQEGGIAPVDLAQAAIGPGMAVFTRYRRVLEPDGSPMQVRTALALINQVLDEYLAEQQGECDADTRWAVAWFEQFGMDEGPYGVAETLCTAKNTSISGLQTAGIVMAKAGKVRLLRRDELPEDWDPSTDRRLTCWEMTQHLIRQLVDKGSEEAAARLLARLGARAQEAHNLAYRLYQICERKKWAGEALGYNALAATWPELVRLSRHMESSPTVRPKQKEMFD